MRIAMLLVVTACAAAPMPIVVETTPAAAAPAEPPAPMGDPPACANVAGTWEVDGCGGDTCKIRQRGCSTSLACGGGAKSYSGSVQGDEVTYTGENVAGMTATCRATVRGDTMKGSCSSAGLPSCRFTATRE